MKRSTAMIKLGSITYTKPVYKGLILLIVLVSMLANAQLIIHIIVFMFKKLKSHMNSWLIR